MSHYIHHVPGRLRVRSRTFRCKPHQLRAMADRLLMREGVEAVDFREKAGSITVRYDPTVLDQRDLLAAFEHSGCFEIPSPSVKEHRPASELAQKALFGTLVQLTVERSVRSLVTALL